MAYLSLYPLGISRRLLSNELLRCVCTGQCRNVQWAPWDILGGTKVRELITLIQLKASKRWFWMVPSRKLTWQAGKSPFLNWDTSSNGWLSIVMLFFQGYNNSRLKSYKRPQKERIVVFQANHLFSGAEPVKLQGCITHVTSDKKKSGEHKIWDRLFSPSPQKRRDLKK